MASMPAAGKFSNGLTAVFRQSGKAEKFFCAGADLLYRDKIQTSLIFHDLIHIHVLPHGIFLCDYTDFPFDVLSLSRENLSVDADLSAGGQKQGGEHADGRGFPCAVWPQESEKLSGFNPEVQ